MYYIFTERKIQMQVAFEEERLYNHIISGKAGDIVLSYRLETGKAEPLYEQLYRSIRSDIFNGILTEGERLPSRRSFAENLGVSTITVETAYLQLEAEGYISARPRRGYFVERIVRSEARPLPDSQPRISKEPEVMNVFADLTGGDAGSADFPFSVWSKLMRELLSESREELLTRAPGNGVFALRSAIAGHLKNFRGMTVDPEQIVIGAGTDHLYGLIVQLLGLDKRYAVEDPGYVKIVDVYRSLGAECRHIPIDRGGIEPEALKTEGIDVVHISPAHHFPTGRVMPATRRHELLAWAAEKAGRYIIEDEYDSEFRFNGKPIPTLQSDDTQGSVIYMNTFTKTLASTIRISYMVLPTRLVEQYRKRLGFYSCAVSNFEQYTLARFIERGYFEKHINRMRKSSRIKRNELLKCIANSPLRDIVDIMEEDAGLHFLMKIRMRIPDADFCVSAMKAGIKIDPLSNYFSTPNKSSEHIFIVNYAAIRIENMREMLERINSIISES